MVERHTHNGVDAERLQPQAIAGLYKTVTTIPTYTPTNFLDQIVIYDDGIGDFFLYVYDNENGAWRVFDYSPNP